MDEDASVRVAVRVRPIDAIPDGCTRVCSVCHDNQVTIVNDDAVVYSASYDHVYDQSSEQASIFNDLALPLLMCFFDGYNATILAYGQTGSGKTFTMGTSDTAVFEPDELGIIPRAIAQVFATVEERQEQMSITVKASFLEIYNEEVKDLLAPASGTGHAPRNIMIRENKDGSIVVNGLTERVVSSAEHTLQCLQHGAQFRTTGSTLMNAVSSRSHAIFTLSLEQRFPPPEGSSVEEVRLSKFHFVDLAGSERQKRTKAVGERLREGISINCGLLALGNVISVLGDPMKRGSHVPYRDSRLTRMLQDSLGGNSKTVFIGCISPAYTDMDEGKNSLRYANRARNIQNKAVINLDTASSEIVTLRHRIALLESVLVQHGIEVPAEAAAGNGSGGAMGAQSPAPTVTQAAHLPAAAGAWFEGNEPQPESEFQQPSSVAAGSDRGQRQTQTGPAPTAAWVDPAEVPLPAPSTLRAEISGDDSTGPVDSYGIPVPDGISSELTASDPFGIHIDAADGIEDVGDDITEGIAGTDGEEDAADAADGDTLPTEHLPVDSAPPKLTRQLHSLESKLQRLESERRAAEARLQHSRKERESEAQQHALRVAVLEKEIAMVTQEMVRITTSASKKKNSKDAETSRVKLELDEKLARMKQELTELRAAYKETQKKLSMQRSSTERIQNLQSAIAGIKEEKAKLLRRMREDSSRSREKTEKERRNNAHLQKSLSRKTWEVTKLKAEKDRQELILERKKEEVQLNKQKLVELQNKMQRSDESYRPRSASAVAASFVSSLRSGAKPRRSGSTQRKQHRVRQQKLRQLGKQLVSTASRRRGLQDTVRKERAARDTAVRRLEELYEQKEDDAAGMGLDLAIGRFEEEIDAKNQTIAAMHDAMNDEDLNGTPALLSNLPVEDYGDLISILVEIAARSTPTDEALENATRQDVAATPKKVRGSKKKSRPGSEPRRRRSSRRNSTGSTEGDIEAAASKAASLEGGVTAAFDAAVDGGDLVAALSQVPTRSSTDAAAETFGSDLPVDLGSSIPLPVGSDATTPAAKSRSPPIIPLPGDSPPSQLRLSGSAGGASAASGKDKAASHQHSVFDRLSEAGEKPKPVSHRDGIYVAATRREKLSKQSSAAAPAADGAPLSSSRRSFHFQTTLVGHRGAVYDAATNEASTKVYSASQDTTVLEWDVETSKVTGVCESHQGFVRAVVVANRGDLGDLALSGAQDSCIKLWDMRAPHGSRCVATLTDHTAEVCFLSVVGDKLFSGSADATVKYWDIRQRKCVDTLRGHKSTVFAVAAAAAKDGGPPCMYFTGSRDHTIKVWDANFRCRQTIQAHTDSVTALVVCGDHLFSSSRENRIKKWHIDVDDAEGVPVTKVKSFRAHNDWVCAMAMQQEEATMPALLSASRDGSVRVWDSTECTHLGTLTGHSSSVNSVVAHPAGKLTLTASSDRTVKIWSTRTR